MKRFQYHCILNAIRGMTFKALWSRSFNNKKDGMMINSLKQFRWQMLFLAGALVMLTLSSALHANSDAPEAAAATEARPYKATTVDECIREKACVRYAFERLATTVRESEDKDDIEPAFTKWDAGVAINVMGTNKDKYAPLIQEGADQFAPVFPYMLKFGADRYNVLFFFSSDFDQDINVKYRKAFQQLMNGDAVADHYKQLKEKSQDFEDGKNTCFNLEVNDKNSGVKLLSMVFVKEDHEDAAYCVKSKMFQTFGFYPGLKNFEFSVMGQDGVQNPEFTKLDLLLVKLFYHPSFRVSMNHADLQKTFDKIYPELLPYFEEWYAGREANKAEEVKPYKATTVDECVREKACVWSVFESLVQGEGIEKDDPEGVKPWRLTKWGGPVIFKILGNPNDQYTQEVQDIIDVLKPHFPYELAIKDKGITHILIFTDDIKRAFYQDHHAYLKRAFQQNLWMLERSVNAIKKPDRVVVPLHTASYKVIANTTFIDVSQSDYKALLKEMIVRSFGFTGSKNAPFSVTNFESLEDWNITDLDLFMMRVLYHPAIHFNMDHSELEAAFQSVYPEVLSGFVAAKSHNEKEI